MPIRQADAKTFVRQVHRHNPQFVGSFFQVAVAVGDQIVGVGVAGRPTNKTLDDGWTVEIIRTATDGHRNATSMLDGALVRAAWALGYRKVITYTLKRESGASLRAAGFVVVAEFKGREWTTKSRPRVLKGGPQLEIKLRWEQVA